MKKIVILGIILTTIGAMSLEAAKELDTENQLIHAQKELNTKNWLNHAIEIQVTFDDGTVKKEHIGGVKSFDTKWHGKSINIPKNRSITSIKIIDFPQNKNKRKERTTEGDRTRLVGEINNKLGNTRYKKIRLDIKKGEMTTGYGGI